MVNPDREGRLSEIGARELRPIQLPGAPCALWSTSDSCRISYDSIRGQVITSMFFSLKEYALEFTVVSIGVECVQTFISR